MDPEDHREDVVRRLLERGLSPNALRALLPDWQALIAHVADATTPAKGSNADVTGGTASDGGDRTTQDHA